MTVKELREGLNKFNPNAEVKIVRDHVVLPNFTIYGFGGSEKPFEKDCNVVYFSNIKAE